nr:hypothetical protein [uncultured bacterium]
MLLDIYSVEFQSRFRLRNSMEDDLIADNTLSSTAVALSRAISSISVTGVSSPTRLSGQLTNFKRGLILAFRVKCLIPTKGRPKLRATAVPWQ